MSKKDTHRMRNVNLKFKFRKWTDSLMNTVRQQQQQQQPSATMATREKWKTVEKGQNDSKRKRDEKNKAGKRQYKGNRAHIHQEDEAQKWKTDSRITRTSQQFQQFDANNTHIFGGI